MLAGPADQGKEPSVRLGRTPGHSIIQSSRQVGRQAHRWEPAFSGVIAPFSVISSISEPGPTAAITSSEIIPMALRCFRARGAGF